MNFADALAELGIDQDASADQARRAYLRLLKTRKPETDPQGFMRLREAYELVKPRLAWRDRYAPTRIVGEATGAAAPEPAPVVAPVEAAAPEPAPPEPAPPEPTLPRPAPPDQAAGDEESEEDAPDSAPDPARIRAFLRGEQHEQAAEELGRLFDLAAKGAYFGAPPMSAALQLILVLYGKSRAAEAFALGASVFEYLRASGEGARAIRGADAARWALLRELAALPRTFPDTVRAAIARAAIAGDLGEATGELAALRRKQPAVAAVAAAALRRSAPVIAAAVANTLAPAPPPSPPPSATPNARGMWALAVIAMGLMRMFSAMESGEVKRSFAPSHPTPPPIEAPVDDPPARPRALVRLGALKRQALQQVDQVQKYVSDAVGRDAGPPRESYDALSKSAADLEDTLEREDCLAARAHARSMMAMFAADGGLPRDKTGRDEASNLAEAVGTYCNALDASRRAGASEP